MAQGPQLPESRQLVSDASFFHRHPLIRHPRGGMGSYWAVCYLFVLIFFFNFFFLTKETSRLSFSDCRRRGWSAETSELGRNLCRNGIFESKHF